MRYKIMGFAMMALMFFCSFAATALDQDNSQNRIHQHRSYQLPETECTCDGMELCTHLPLIRIDTAGQYIPGEIIRDPENSEAVLGYTTTQSGASEILVTIETVETEGEWHHASDPADQSSQALFRIRGNSSRNFDKKSYRIKLVEDNTAASGNDLPLLGMNPDNDWALHGPFLDKTLLRNYMWMNISAEVMGYAPNVRFCELILNGEYQGVYVLMETIKESEYRVDLSDYEEGSTATSYLLQLDAVGTPADQNSADVYLENYTWYTHQTEFSEVSRTGFSILYPQKEYLSEDVVGYIQRDVSRIERGLYSSDMVTGTYDYQSELDVDSFVDYYILQEFLAVNDAFSRSTYLYRDIRGTLHMGPVWDYNNVLNNFFIDLSRRGFLLANRGWYGRLMTSEDFVERVIGRYRQLREGILSDEYLLNYIQEVIDFLGPAIERNDEVWGYSYDPTNLSFNQYRIPDEEQTLAEANASSYEDAIGRMEGYMLSRAEWLDEHIDTLYQYCHPSKNASQWLG